MAPHAGRLHVLYVMNIIRTICSVVPICFTRIVLTQYAVVSFQMIAMQCLHVLLPKVSAPREAKHLRLSSLLKLS